MIRGNFHTQRIYPPAGQVKTLADYISRVQYNEESPMKNVYIVNGGGAYKSLFRSYGFTLVDQIHLANLVCFTGGEDVTPGLYGDAKHRFTFNSPRRDTVEMEVFKKCVQNNIPMVGICRGAQFLNVMSMGRMYQHVSKHGGDHEIVDLNTGETILVSSTHHQMMMPGKDGVVLASSNLMGDREWYDGQVFKKDVSNQDIEVVFYENTKCLCFQPHPELSGDQYTRMKSYFRELITTYLSV